MFSGELNQTFSNIKVYEDGEIGDDLIVGDDLLVGDDLTVVGDLSVGSLSISGLGDKKVVYTNTGTFSTETGFEYDDSTNIMSVEKINTDQIQLGDGSAVLQNMVNFDKLASDYILKYNPAFLGDVNYDSHYIDNSNAISIAMGLINLNNSKFFIGSDAVDKFSEMIMGYIPDITTSTNSRAIYTKFKHNNGADCYGNEGFGKNGAVNFYKQTRMSESSGKCADFMIKADFISFINETGGNFPNASTHKINFATNFFSENSISTKTALVHYNNTSNTFTDISQVFRNKNNTNISDWHFLITDESPGVTPGVHCDFIIENLQSSVYLQLYHDFKAKLNNTETFEIVSDNASGSTDLIIDNSSVTSPTTGVALTTSGLSSKDVYLENDGDENFSVAFGDYSGTPDKFLQLDKKNHILRMTANNSSGYNQFIMENGAVAGSGNQIQLKNAGNIDITMRNGVYFNIIDTTNSRNVLRYDPALNSTSLGALRVNTGIALNIVGTEVVKVSSLLSGKEDIVDCTFPSEDLIQDLPVKCYHRKGLTETYKELGWVADYIEQILDGKEMTLDEKKCFLVYNELDELQGIRSSTVPFLLVKECQRLQSQIDTIIQVLEDNQLM